jgi:hypothetical protein
LQHLEEAEENHFELRLLNSPACVRIKRVEGGFARRFFVVGANLGGVGERYVEKVAGGEKAPETNRTAKPTQT